MLGNHRLFQAVRTLATAKGDVRTRVCIAMADIRVIGSMEFRNMPDLWKRIERLKKETSAKGPYVLNGRTIRNSYENTAYSRQNKTYEKYAEEILAIWLDTCEEENSQP